MHYPTDRGGGFRARPAAISLLIFGALFAFGCLNYSVKTPEGFAVFADEWTVYRAISSDGFRFKSGRRLDNPAEDSSAELWAESLRLHFENEGYRLIRDEKIKSKDEKALPGNLFVTIYRYRNRDYAYVTAVFAARKHLYVLEGAGLFSAYQKREKAILDAFKSFALR